MMIRFSSIIKLLSIIIALPMFIACQSSSVSRSISLHDYYMNDSLEARLQKRQLKKGMPVFLRIFKEEKRLEVWMQPKPKAEYELFGIYPICTYSGSLGPKLREGDYQAPEGFYTFGARHLNPNSQYYRSFNLNYPNAYDKAHQRTGSLLMVHGDCVSVGCYAMTDRQMDEIYTLVEAALENNQRFIRVHIFPFVMNDKRLAQVRTHKWYGFWQQLKPGFDAFEKTRRPPEVEVIAQSYAVIGIES